MAPITGGLAVIVIAAGTAAGLWYLPFAAGLAAGLTARRRRLRVVLLASVGIAVAGWAVPLAWRAWHGEPVGATARAVAALAGLPASAALVVGVTLLVAAVQAITGVWLARAIGGRGRPAADVRGGRRSDGAERDALSGESEAGAAPGCDHEGADVKEDATAAFSAPPQMVVPP